MIKVNRLFIPLFLILPIELVAQSLRIEDLKNVFEKNKPFVLSGGFSANSVLNTGNDLSARDPFTYYLNGSLNVSIYGEINLPFSFSLTNSGLSYKLPSSPNRLSIHPSFRWITGHIGDVSMTFSPYTMNGHIFTGAGVELTPDGWEIGALYGRFQKAVEYDEAKPAFLPTYKRMGYGFKAGRVSEKYRVMLNIFEAKDQIHSLTASPDSFGITPMQNLASSIAVLIKPVKSIEFSGEYGISFLTSDIRITDKKNGGIESSLPGNNLSSTYYNAFKFQLSYLGDNNRLGIGYERIDPGYRTLGAYYFTNDLENITVNAYQSFWTGKMNLSVSLGLERDDLANDKASATSRIVGSANLTGNFSEKVNANLSYTNFQTYTNLRSNFELINQEVTLDKLDTLNYIQLSQSLNMNLNVTTKKTEKQIHSLSMNMSYQDAANKQGGVYRPGSVTEMINASATYMINFAEKGISLGSALNLNNSRIQNDNSFTWGPTVNLSALLFKKKVNLSGSASYNTSRLSGIKQSDVFLVRFNSAYSPIKRHNVTLAYTFQRRTAIINPAKVQSLVMLGYSLNF